MIKTAACYQMICRALPQQQLFQDAADYQYYFLLLRKYKMKFGIRIYGFCLLPDCVHMVMQAESDGNLQNFMQMVNCFYVLYFNEKYRRVGRLWQGRYQSALINHIEDLFSCIKQVEFDPVRAQLTDSPIEYQWSSCIYRILKERNMILDPLAFAGSVLGAPFH